MRTSATPATALIDLAAALSQTRLKSEMGVRTLKKSLELQRQNALVLLQAAAPAGSSRHLDLRA